MNFTPLVQRPWLRPSAPVSLPAHWCDNAAILALRQRWLNWLVDQPSGQWLLHQPDPLQFTAALLALWIRAELRAARNDLEPILDQ